MDSIPERHPVDEEVEKPGIVAAVLDFSFSAAITPKIIKPLYIFGLIACALFALKWSYDSMAQHGLFAGMMSFAFAPLVFVVYALITRIFLEVVVALFQIADHLKKIDSKTR